MLLDKFKIKEIDQKIKFYIFGPKNLFFQQSES